MPWSPPVLVLIVLITLGYADPQRTLARQGETQVERTYWAVEAMDAGPARPKWRNRRGTWRCWTFPDGIASRCVGREKSSKTTQLDRRFDAAGAPLTSLVFDDEGAWKHVLVHGPQPVEVDVRTRQDATIGPVRVYGPGNPRSAADTEVRWELPQGALAVAALPVEEDVFDPAFGDAIRARCACVIEDRSAVWLAGLPGVRYRLRTPDSRAPSVTEVWALPTGDALVLATFTTPATGTLAEIQARLAHGRAWIALTEPAPPSTGAAP